MWRTGKSLGGQRLRKVHHGGAAARSGKGGDSCAVAEKNVPPRTKVSCYFGAVRLIVFAAKKLAKTDVM